MEEKKFRNKVGWFQFLCCAMVIWSHAGNAELFLGKEPLAVTPGVRPFSGSDGSQYPLLFHDFGLSFLPFFYL